MPKVTAFETQKARVIAIGIEVQRQLAQDVIEIQAAVEAGQKLQSWPVALGDPDAQLHRFGVQRFGTRWYLTNDSIVLAALRSGYAAQRRLQAEIQFRCNKAGIDIAFTNHGPKIRIPSPDVATESVLVHNMERPRA